MSNFSTLSLRLASLLSHFGSLVCSLLSSNPKPIFSNPKSCVVVAAAEVGVGVGCHRWWRHGFPSSSPSSSSSLFLWSLIPFFLSIFPWINPPWWRCGVGLMDWWLGFIIPDVGFIFGGMNFMVQWMGFIFGGVGGRISLFLGLVVVVFVGRWWVIWWWCG